MITIDYMGTNYIESKSFVIDRPKGSGDYLFLLFKTEIYIRINGEMRHYPSGTALLFDPTYGQYYLNAQKGFLNDWIHFHGPEVVEWLETTGFIVNQPFHITDVMAIENLISAIELQYLKKAPTSLALVDTLLKMLILTTQKDQDLHQITQTTTEDLLRDVRSKVMRQLSYPWTVSEMGQIMGLSRSRFSTLYKALFGLGPKEDLNNERMLLAKHLLTNPTLSIGQIALKVGYESLYHFSKQFKLKYGLAPSTYRRSDQ